MRNVATVARRFANLERSKPVPMARAETWVAWLTAGEVDHLWSVTEGRDDSVFDIEAEPYRARAAERRAQVPYSLWSKINRSMDYLVPFDETFDPVSEVRGAIASRWSDRKKLRLDLSRLDIGELQVVESIRDPHWHLPPRGCWDQVDASTADD